MYKQWARNNMTSTNQVSLDPSGSIEIVWNFETWKCFLLNVAWGKPFEIGVEIPEGLKVALVISATGRSCPAHK